MTGADLSTAGAALPQFSRFVEIGPVPVRIVRITYMGELGYELYIPTEYAHAAHDALLEGIRAAGVEPVHCGLMALESLRLEKGYRDFAVDIDNTDTPLEAGLGFVVDFEKPEFIGREALLAQKAAGPLTKRLVQFLLSDPEPLLHGNEPILCDGAMSAISARALSARRWAPRSVWGCGTCRGRDGRFPGAHRSRSRFMTAGCPPPPR